MGKPTGFMEWDRAAPHRRPIALRVLDYKEVEELDPPDVSRQQAGRCMDCGVPFCTQGCPLGNPIPDFAHAIWTDRWHDAHKQLAVTNEFPEFTGRLCPAPCEGACVLAIGDPKGGSPLPTGEAGRAPSPHWDAVTIEHLERSIIERAFAEGWVTPRPPLARTGKRVAIVGSGPAGLAAAAHLNRAGHTVTVFEAAPRPGGLLRYGIPDFKMEKEVIDRRLAILEAEGVQFRCNVTIGGSDPSYRTAITYAQPDRGTGLRVAATPTRSAPAGGTFLGASAVARTTPPTGVSGASALARATPPGGVPLDPPPTSITWKQLRAEHDAVIIAIGAQRARDLDVPGRNLAGVTFAMDFLVEQNEVVAGDRTAMAAEQTAMADERTAMADGRPAATRDVRGKHVVILGGGDTGSDCLGTAHRQGAATVRQIELMPAPPDHRSAANPWPAWPVVFRTSSSQEEGGERTFAFRTTKLEGDASGKLVALHGVQVELRDGKLVDVPGTELRIACDVLVLALGFTGPDATPLVEQLGISVDSRKVIVVDKQYATNVKGVFCAGDAHRGASLIVWAIAEGRDTARAVDTFLRA
jgi:glutamate synthase (NADPH/NADH) small chain